MGFISILGGITGLRLPETVKEHSKMHIVQNEHSIIYILYIPMLTIISFYRIHGSYIIDCLKHFKRVKSLVKTGILKIVFDAFPLGKISLYLQNIQ